MNLIADDPYPEALTGLDELERNGRHPGAALRRGEADVYHADCIRCDEEMLARRLQQEKIAEYIAVQMIVCSSCGNKRCPRATDHRNSCTGSNEPGQLGSIYAAQ